jgi:vanillate O-demethylase monooxygenase subunit
MTSHLADRLTPLIRNCWYVLCWSTEASRDLRSRRVCGDDVLFYRTSAGQVAVMRNRCRHRSFPLSRGRLQGDNVVCGYHGLVYAPSGKCVFAPSDPDNRSDISAQTYPFIEREGLIWIWPGDPTLANQSLIPSTPWFTRPDWDYVSGYMPYPANYVALHENLMDLTHFAYLHTGNIGTQEYAAAPFKVATKGSRVNICRTLERCSLPALLAFPTGLGDKLVTRITDTWYESPALNLTNSTVVDPSPEPGSTARFEFKVVHFITPATQSTTHNFYAVARKFRVGDPSVPEHTRMCFEKAFREDQDALMWIEEAQALEGIDFAEIHVRSDRGSLLMRRDLKKRALQEQSPPGCSENYVA